MEYQAAGLGRGYDGRREPIKDSKKCLSPRKMKGAFIVSIFFELIYYGAGAFVLYVIIRLAVKHGIRDSKM